MKCPDCSGKMEVVDVKVEGARKKAKSFQCDKCGYFEFDPVSSKEVVEELRNAHLKLKQRIVKLSAGRVGIYFGKDIIRSLNLKSGEDVYVSVPDKKHIVLELT
ncbi:MAG: hypothetical protein V1702_00150 [Candidatus Woesearchaeota archaeon]